MVDTYTEDDFSFAGQGLVRPECVLALANGRLVVSNFEGGFSVIEPDGRVWHRLARGAFRPKTNGLCLLPDGAVLVTHLGETGGGVFRIGTGGGLTPSVVEADGVALPPTNFVHRDQGGRLWITVSTRKVPRALGYTADTADGFIVLADGGRARIVADGLGFANECHVHPDGERVFVNETFSKRMSVFRIVGRGDLRLESRIEDFGEGEFPDGLAFDAQGGVWVASIVANRLIRFDADGRRSVVLDGFDAGHVRWYETAYRRRGLTSDHMKVSNGVYGNVSSLAFGGADLRTVYVGNLLGTRIAWFRQPVAGAPPPHWHFSGP